MEEKQLDSGIRINKFLSDAGVCSRREADRWLEAGRISIDGEKALMGSKVLSGQSVLVDGKSIKKEESKILLAFHKPKGIVCTTSKDDPNNIVDFIHYEKRIYPIGRLDKDSEGLILLTNQGELVDKILRGSNCHEKEYLVKVNKKITEDFIVAMGNGVPILDTVTRACVVTKVDEYTFQIILTQGLNRQIRRMCEHLDYKVTMLRRIRIMNLKLGRLRSGTYRRVTAEELAELERGL